jgi:hypothetical protein
MDYLKQFLKELSKDGIYYAEMVENCAEIYIIGDTTPAVLLELQDDFYHVNFRCDVPVRQIAQIMYDMTNIDPDIIVEAEFMISQDHGVIYGQNAMALFYMTVYSAMEHAQAKQEAGLDGVIYVVEQPIEAFCLKSKSKTKIQKMWENE